MSYLIAISITNAESFFLTICRILKRNRYKYKEMQEDESKVLFFLLISQTFSGLAGFRCKGTSISIASHLYTSVISSICINLQQKGSLLHCLMPANPHIIKLQPMRMERITTFLATII